LILGYELGCRVFWQEGGMPELPDHQITTSVLTFVHDNQTLVVGILTLLVTGGGAWATIFFISIRTVQISWSMGFRQEHADFWNNIQLNEPRRWVTNDNEYDEIKTVIAKRNRTSKLEKTEAAVLDQIDKLLAALLRMHLFSKYGKGKVLKVWASAYQIYWIPLIKRRPELLEYVQNVLAQS
jgi:hypothetical protein